MASAAPDSMPESWLRWPSGIPQDYAPPSQPALAYAQRMCAEGLMDPMQIHYIQSFQIGSFGGLSMPICEPPVSYNSAQNHLQTAISNSSPAPPLSSIPRTSPVSLLSPTPESVPVYRPSPVSQPSPVTRPASIAGSTKEQVKRTDRNSDRISKSKTRRQKKQSRRGKASQSKSSLKIQAISKESVNFKTIRANQAQDLSQQAEFDTGVDQLMRVIQHGDSQDDTHIKQEQCMLTPAPSPKQEPVSPSPARKSATPRHALPTTKRFKCAGPNCNQVFTQKGHLTIHLRTHTGEKPYMCEYLGCNQRFSQLGNMKTHMRRHVGEKPFKCDDCGKSFVQRSILKTHEKTHSPSKPFACILEGCEKPFSSRGNMKQHQNQYHRDTLEELTAKFRDFAQQGQVPEEYRELYEYFKIHYKNSNKGVKGRGKARRVAGVESWTVITSVEPSERGRQSCETESPAWDSYSHSDLDLSTPSSPMSVAGQLFPESTFDSPITIDSPFY